MKLKMCNCRQCKAGRKKKWGKRTMLKVKRHGRRLVKQLIKIGRYDDIPTAVSVPYTD